MESQIFDAVKMLIPMILSLSVHEYSHARAAKILGDRTSEDMGRLTLNPLAHIDPIGTLALPLMGFIFGGFIFGWARPVPVNPIHFTRRYKMKTSMLMVAAAGPASNVVLAILSTALYYIMVKLGIYNQGIATLFSFMIQLNIILAFFNLLPIPPLDGGRILAGLLPDSAQPVLSILERFGFIILIFLLFSGAISILFVPVRILSSFLLNLPFG